MCPYTFGKTGVKNRFYDIYLRPQAAYTRPTSQSELTDLLATAEKIGEVENKNAKLTLEPTEMTELGDGNEVAGAYKGSLEIKHMNNLLANVQALEDTYDNVDCDAIFHDPVFDEVRVWKDITLHIKTETNSGEKIIAMISGNKTVPTKATLEDKFDEPAS